MCRPQLQEQDTNKDVNLSLICNLHRLHKMLRDSWCRSPCSSQPALAYEHAVTSDARK